MLAYLSVENFFSFKDKTTLSLDHPYNSAEKFKMNTIYSYCRRSRSNAIDSSQSAHTNSESFKTTHPALSDEYTINWFHGISTLSYMDILITVLRNFE
jgi:hypothetical protein